MTICSSFHTKDRAAKSYMLIVANAERAEKWDIDKSQYIEAKDGSLLRLGAAFCGIHNKDIVRKGRDASVDMVDSLGGPADPLALDFVKRTYETRLDREAERKAQQEAQYHEHQKELAVEPVVVGEREPRRSNEFTVLLVNGNSGKPVAEVYVSLDAGVARVGVSNYSGHVGRGQGNLSYLRALRDALGKAEEFMVENYKANGLEV